MAWTERVPVEIPNRDGMKQIDAVYRWIGHCRAFGREVRRVSDKPFPAYDDSEVWCLDPDCVRKRERKRRRRPEAAAKVVETGAQAMEQAPLF